MLAFILSLFLFSSSSVLADWGVVHPSVGTIFLGIDVTSVAEGLFGGTTNGFLFLFLFLKYIYLFIYLLIYLFNKIDLEIKFMLLQIKELI
jgi:hypothetical protein